jgi:hypothetical protein
MTTRGSKTYVTEITAPDGTILGKIVTDYQPTEEDIAAVTAEAVIKRDRSQEISDQEVPPTPEPTGEPIEATVEDELSARRGRRRSYIKDHEGNIVKTYEKSAEIFHPDFDLGQ